MKRKIFFLAFILLTINSLSIADVPEYKQGEVLVRFISDGTKVISLSQRTSILSIYVGGCQAVKDLKLVPGLTIVKLPEGSDVMTAVDKFVQSPLVMYAQPNYIYKSAAIPNDPFFNFQWGLNNTGQTGGTVDADIDAPEAWDIYTGGTNIIVGVVDTGIDYNHPDLRPNMWVNAGEIPGNGVDDDGNGYVDDIYGWNAFANNGNPIDDNLHGTHCAGIIGAVGNNGIGVSGVCWRVRIMALKMFDWQGFGSTVNAIECFAYAMKNGAQVLSNSWAGYGYDQALYDAIAEVQAAGILFVAAASNEANNNDTFPAYPASFDLDNIISVMATDHDDEVAYFSNYGLTTVDIAAPGVDIFSTMPTYETNDINDYGFSTYYDWLDGTSMSAPFVAGACALVWSYVPQLEYQDVKDVVLNSADRPPSLSGMCVSEGRLNLFYAISAVSNKVLNKNTGKIYIRIQDAIDDPLTLNGHTLIAHKGPEYLSKVYFFENIDFKGKKVTLRSGDIYNTADETLYPEKVVISGRGGNKHTVSFVSGEDAGAVLKGFTIADGYANGPEMEDKFGGGIYLNNSSPVISDCIITNNQAVIDGGGIYCDNDSNPLIQNCTIIGNRAAGRDGGGIYCYDSSPLIKNCLIAGNTAARDGGGIYLNGPSLTDGQVQILDCTISDNLANTYDGYGGAVYCYWSSEPDITDCIISNNNGYAIYEEDLPSDPQVTFCLFYNNYGVDWFDADTGMLYTGAAAVNSLPEASDNIDGNPFYTIGRLGNYYLSQIAAGQLDESAAVDEGSDTALNLGMNIYSTRTDNVKDVGKVDMGFHYNDPCAPVTYSLTTSVSPAGRGTIDPAAGIVHTYPQYAHVQLTATASNSSYWFKAWYGTDDDSRKDVDENAEPISPQYNLVTMDSDKSVLAEFEKINVMLTVTITSGVGSISVSPPPQDPRRDLYRRGTVVTITVTPADPSNRIKWIGSDDDTSRQFVNTVTMTQDKTVYIELREPRTLIVGGGGIPGAYTNVEDAIEESLDGDTIVVHEGVWSTDWQYLYWTIYGKDITIRSTNPDDPSVVANTVFQSRLEFENVTRNMVVAGITFRDYTYFGVGGADGSLEASECDGFDGVSVFGVGMRMGLLNRSLMIDPIFYDFVQEASPTIINCVFENINAEGGDGGNNGCGCPGFDNDGGWAGRAYGGAIYVGIRCNPLFKNCTIRDCNALGGDSGNGCVHPGSWGDPDPAPGEGWSWYFGPYDLPWNYTGKGGGAYIDVNSAPEFMDCEFIDNLARGGSTGVGATPHWRIDSYGGAVYCAAASKPKFTNCRFVDNRVAVTDILPLWRWKENTNEDVFIADKYFGFGGAIAVEGKVETFDGYEFYADAGRPVFENCTFENNLSPNGNGGAFHCQYGGTNPLTETIIDKCTLTGNQALHGGAIYSVDSLTTILESTFSGNDATDVVGEGGAVYAFGGTVNISDSNLNENSAVSSGGAVYLGDSNSLIWNCLLRGNETGRDGGGVSANIYSDCNIVNTTITGNLGGRYGGGAFCSYNSYVRILDSIIWGNMAANGHQLAVAEDDPYNPEPSVVEVSYSLVGPRYGYEAYGLEQEDSVYGLGGGYSSKVIETDRIYNELGSSGTAKVLVTLQEPIDLKKQTDWDDPASVALLQTEIYNIQQAVISTLNAGEFTLRYRYKNVAAFSGEVTTAGLNKLISSMQVKYIEPVREMFYQMRQSLTLANGNGVRPAYGGAGVGIAICDSGFDYRHPDLGDDGFPNDKIVGGYDFGSMDNDPQQEGEPHGTACAGIAAGSIDNYGDYVGGVAYDAGIFAFKISEGAGPPLDDAALMAWDWCITHKNDNSNYPILIISNSWGTGVVFDDPLVAEAFFPALTAAADTATASGITVMAASGNGGSVVGISAPAAFRNVISVGAVYDTTDQVAVYSNSSPLVDILAPGDPIYTTDVIGPAGYTSGNFTPDFAGTSAACPFAAGTAAVLQAAAKDIIGHYLTPEQVRGVLAASGDLVTDTKVAITKPRVNIGNSISLLTAGPIYLESGCVIRYGWWNAATKTWSPASHNLSIDEDPMFVEGYHLSQEAAGEDVTSAAVDAGSTDAYTAGKYRHTTRTDLVVEDLDSIVDMGYHYIRETELAGDFNYDGRVDGLDETFTIIVDDLMRLLRHWLDQCEFPDYCHGTDLTKDGIVNNKDYSIYAGNWNKKETTPPQPDPMTWKIFPRSAPQATWATMEATKAMDMYGGTIEYKIERTNASGVPDGFVRDWDPSRTFTNTGLTKNVKYGYRVKARDARGNETGWSVIGYVVIGKEAIPFPPSNLTALTLSQSQIRLTWTDNANNESGFKIERFTGTQQFAEVATVGANVTTFTNSGLTSNTTYTYRVCAYNDAGKSDYTNMASATTMPPIPVPQVPVILVPPSDPNSEEYYSDGYWYHSVVANVPELGTVPVWFRFECISAMQLSSGWYNAAATFPHPVNPNYPAATITVNGTIVTYTIVIKEGGAFGWSLSWRVCDSYSANGANKVCSTIVTIPPPP